ncbi:hypothetical protein CAOG_08474 [Capsaspora owczarzaki ATCC 30864]|uniref:KxDL domain-containing protein n=1 Tax=Capsaspora owczarzaki (strain ATCC 30864) TaxID=595528 RepID=A0A0D2VIA4_CAPO3|nr:hypothetical protein CAOG_08474 [Capsaspora owczarzaki ATCC 30864]KJE89677.1 hypothetical protein CAOG_008474 [Capsaspora owczarzaki ATCC 30864]|eukprot:XP_011270046.1 hypothetical protein CAOG_08474 [Capsaspora owczarzaki ATCC 30864]
MTDELSGQAPPPPPLDASTVFANKITSGIDHGAVNDMLRQQRLILGRFERTNARLSRFNEHLDSVLGAHTARFKSYTHQLVDAKKDLESIFRRIRALRAKLTQQYPEAFFGLEMPGNISDDDDDDYGDEDEEHDPRSKTAARPQHPVEQESAATESSEVAAPADDGAAPDSA